MSPGTQVIGADGQAVAQRVQEAEDAPISLAYRVLQARATSIHIRSLVFMQS